MPLPSYTADDFAAAFQGLMPTGAVWPTDPDTVNAQTVEALMPSAVRSWQSILNLIVDAFPSTTVQLLPDWEASLGLPDPCAPIDSTLAARQAHVVARLTQTYGPSIAGITAFAAALGYTITITELVRTRFGTPAFGGKFAGDAWSHTWQVNAVGYVITPLTFGGQAFGQAFSTWTSSVLVCELQRIRPAHTIVMWETGAELIPVTPVVPVVTVSDGVITSI